MRTSARLVFAVVLISLLAACVAGSADSQHAAQSGVISQLVLGLWHGIIAPFTLIGEIINRIAPGLLPWKIGFFETANHDVLYDIGFYFGIAGGPPIIISGWSRRRVR